MAYRTMSKTQERVIKLISQPKSQRSNPEIHFVLPWLKKKSDILMKMADSNLKEIVRNCEFLKTDNDEVIIKQGDQGDCLYILLKGTVSVYINDRLEKNDDEGSEDTTQSSGGNKSKNWLLIANELVEDLNIRGSSSNNKKTERKQLGKKIISFGSGKSFGEIALLTEDNIRTASIISDEECHLLIIKRQLYNATLKAYHEKDFKEKRDFINNSPLFMNWSLQHKRQLERGLIKECYSPDMPIIKQGEEIKGLSFIREGIAKVLIEPEKHSSQYPHMSPFPTENDILELEHMKSTRGSAKSTSSTASNTDSNQTSSINKVQHVSFEHIHVRRKQGYAAAEKRVMNKSIILCTVRNGAMFGDVEMMQNLKTYCQSVTSLTYTEIYNISQKNVERLIHKKHPSTLKTMRDIVIWKMCNRATTVQGSIIPFVQHLVFKMTEEKKPEPRILPSLHTSGRLPDKEVMFQTIVQEYLNNRAQLIEPIVPGGVYYKAVMRKKAKQRAKERHRVDTIRREQMEKEMRTRIAAYSNTLQNSMDTAWVLSDDEDEEDDYGNDTELSKDPKGNLQTTGVIMTPRILSQSDPMLSRPNSSRESSSVKAFMTEVDEKADSIEQESSAKWKQKQEKTYQTPYSAIDKKNTTICLVYDESLGTSKIVHYGSTDIKINEHESQPKQIIDADIREEDEESCVSAANSMGDNMDLCSSISDGKMVGAPSHMISKSTLYLGSHDNLNPNISITDSAEGYSIIPLGNLQGNSGSYTLPPITNGLPRGRSTTLPNINNTNMVMTHSPKDGVLQLTEQNNVLTNDSHDMEGSFSYPFKQRARTAIIRRPNEDVVNLPHVFTGSKVTSPSLVESVL